MKTIFAACAAVGTMIAGAAAQVQVDSALPTYTTAQGVSGSIKSIGSDTLNNLMTYWAEDFKKAYPNVKIEIEGKGSSTAPPALIEGQAQFGPMSRPMKGAEIDSFEKKYGYKPVELRTAVDALAVYVHKDCPLNELSMDQVRKIFSVDGPDMTWGDVGVKDPAWATKPISLYGRNSASGTYGFFKEHALNKKDYKPSVKEQPGSSAVVQAVATDKFGMGYSGLGYKTADVKAVKIAAKDGETAYEANAQNSYDGVYPLARFLYVYVNHKPGSTMDPLRAEFIKKIFSRQGQESVVKDGYFPITADIAREDLKKVGLPVRF
ncbi:MAG: phosphate ABC transporter substrate-binding protein PstS family protein [Phycisphaeraceae bacterium]|nr:phosphate ABC transporter substrate-binding protein PstS family protein [Phycisphaeraceae bacterium]MBX3405913.1 phosphate ABC transporter substrate-binding protein PstS family protein [Phycisphaeraceae bacterium]